MCICINVHILGNNLRWKEKPCVLQNSYYCYSFTSFVLMQSWQRNPRPDTLIPLPYLFVAVRGEWMIIINRCSRVIRRGLGWMTDDTQLPHRRQVFVATVSSVVRVEQKYFTTRNQDLSFILTCFESL